MIATCPLCGEFTVPWGDHVGDALMAEHQALDCGAVTRPCWRCGADRSSLCCSSHGKRLCHGCYRRTHFVVVCVEGCPECVAEGLPVVLTEVER